MTSTFKEKQIVRKIDLLERNVEILSKQLDVLNEKMNELSQNVGISSRLATNFRNSAVGFNAEGVINWEEKIK